MKIFTAYVEFDPETKLYVGIVPGIPGAHTQAKSLDELQKNLKEVVTLYLEEDKIPAKELLSKTFSSAMGAEVINKKVGQLDWPALKGGGSCGA